MNTKKSGICNFFIFLSIGLLFYILISFIIDYSNIDYTSYDETLYITKVIILAFFFVVSALAFTVFKLYKNKIAQEEIKQKTEDIVNENETLKIYSHIDPLTQCLNEKFFTERLKEEFKRAIREKQAISLLIVNIDEFKSFTDIYGINEGNECLKIIANILVNKCNRPIDLIAKFEGDEFYILLPNTNDPKTVANNCVKAVNSLNIPHDNSIASNVLTISIGTSILLPTKQEQLKTFVENAKKALKNAKRSGRNRVF